MTTKITVDLQDLAKAIRAVAAAASDDARVTIRNRVYPPRDEQPGESQIVIRVLSTGLGFTESDSLPYDGEAEDSEISVTLAASNAVKFADEIDATCAENVKLASAKNGIAWCTDQEDPESARRLYNDFGVGEPTQ